MAAVLFPTPTPEVEQWLAERRAKGLDIRDEEWEGVYVVIAPAPSGHAWIEGQLIAMFMPPARARGLRVGGITNIGKPQNYRVPDVTVWDPRSGGTWLAAAKVVVEIRSPGEPHEEKLSHYAACPVDEVVLVDPEKRSRRWLALRRGAYEATDRSEVLGLIAADVADALDWD